MSDPKQAVHVHIKSSEVPFVAATRRQVLHVSYTTVVLTAANPYSQLVGLARNRKLFVIVAGGANATAPTCDFVICDKEAEANKQSGAAESGSAISGQFLPGNIIGYTEHKQYGVEQAWIAAVGSKAADGTAFPIYVGVAEYMYDDQSA